VEKLMRKPLSGWKLAGRLFDNFHGLAGGDIVFRRKA